MRFSYLLITLFSIGASSFAQTAQPPGPHCADGDGFGDFDFWVGEWKVYSNDEQRRFFGENSITKHHGECLLKEDWRGAGGSAGFSVNYFNSVTGEWRQVWVANGYSIDYTGGLNDSGSMVLLGSIYNYSKGTASRFRGTWTPLEGGNVVQLFEVFDDEQQRWTVWFEGLYVLQS